MKRHIATIPKNKGEEIRVGLDEYKGYKLAFLRVFVTAQAAGLAVRADGAHLVICGQREQSLR